MGCMTTLEWNSSFETGIKQIDDQHRELFRRIDKLELAIYKCRAIPELRSLLEYLESYVFEHFETEEELMRNINYPEYSAHVKEHSDFRNSIKKILTEYKGKGADSYLAINVNKQMRKWLEHHILIIDMKFIPFINN